MIWSSFFVSSPKRWSEARLLAVLLVTLGRMFSAWSRLVKPRIYKEALGIRVGDIVTTSYGTGPYVVWSIWGPKLWHAGHPAWTIWPWPVISLMCVYAEGHHSFGRLGFSYLNEIHQEADRWITAGGNEVFVAPPVGGYPDLPTDMFLSFPPAPEPYPFQDRVDYAAWAWHCRCGLDFNEVRDGHSPPLCPDCQCVPTRIVMAAAEKDIPGRGLWPRSPGVTPNSHGRG